MPLCSLLCGACWLSPIACSWVSLLEGKRRTPVLELSSGLNPLTVWHSPCCFLWWCSPWCWRCSGCFVGDHTLFHTPQYIEFICHRTTCHACHIDQNHQTSKSHHQKLLSYTAYKDIQLIHSAGLEVASSCVAPSLPLESWSLCAALTCYAGFTCLDFKVSFTLFWRR